MLVYKVSDYIKYGEEFYKVLKIEIVQGIQTELEIAPIIKKKEDIVTQTVSTCSPSLFLVAKEIQEKLVAYLKFIDRYNSTIRYLNKKTKNKFIYLDVKHAENDIKLYYMKCKLQLNHLNKIERCLKKTQLPVLQLHHIKENAFDFITEEYQLISFEKADHICEEFKQNVDFKIKCLAWSYCLYFKKYNSFYIPKVDFIKDFIKFCQDYSKDNSIYLPYLEQTNIDVFIDGKYYKTTRYLLEKETVITDLTLDLFYDQKYDFTEEELNKEINKYEKSKSLKDKPFILEPEQIEAVKSALTNKFCVITGPPGTGKTEIIKCILRLLSQFYLKYTQDKTNRIIVPESLSLMAPTGLAFINMKKGQNKDEYNDEISGTCHRTLYHTFENIKKHAIECTCLEGKCEYNYKIKAIILDESSMIDILMFYEILKMCEEFNARLILLGDVNQLESIGPGTVLKSLIKSEYFDVTKLTTIKRQSSGALIDCIKKMNENTIIDSPQMKDSSMEVIDINNFVKDGVLVEEAITKLLDAHKCTKEFTKVITYYNTPKYTCNTGNINNILQNKYNPLTNGAVHLDWVAAAFMATEKMMGHPLKKSCQEIPSNNKYECTYTFRVNDLIVRTENDYTSETMRANGEEAVITAFNDEDEVMIVYNDGSHLQPEIMTRDELYDNFILNYCVNIHKSQGSQYKTVIIFIQPGHFNLSKPSIYTAISRGKENCILITDMNDFINCQKNTTSDKVSLFMRKSLNYGINQVSSEEEFRTTCQKCSCKKTNNDFKFCYDCNLEEGKLSKTAKCIKCQAAIKPHPRFKTCYKCNNT